MSMLCVSEDLCLQALRSLTRADSVPNRARSSVSMLCVSEDLCLQAIRGITLIDKTGLSDILRTQTFTSNNTISTFFYNNHYTKKWINHSYLLRTNSLGLFFKGSFN